MAVDWCSLSMEEKILAVLRAFNDPVPLIVLEAIIYIMDKVLGCKDNG